MPESTPVDISYPGFELNTSFVRSRNTLLARGDFAPFYVDYYLHRSDNQIEYSAAQDKLFKAVLAGFVLHCASRPWNEMIAWTIHFEELKLNIFLTGDNETGAITGRLFDQDVKTMEGNFFFSDVVRGSQPKRRSVAQFKGNDPLSAIEVFYRSSEQRLIRLIDLGDESYSLLAEHPDCDVTWLASLTTEQARDLDKKETVASMERRVYRWHCGCNQGRMMQVLLPVFKDDPTGVFGSDEIIEMRCPRCAARHHITREAMEAFVTKEGDKGGA